MAEHFRPPLSTPITHRAAPYLFWVHHFEAKSFLLVSPPGPPRCSCPFPQWGHRSCHPAQWLFKVHSDTTWWHRNPKALNSARWTRILVTLPSIPDQVWHRDLQWDIPARPAPPHFGAPGYPLLLHYPEEATGIVFRSQSSLGLCVLLGSPCLSQFLSDISPPWGSQSLLKPTEDPYQPRPAQDGW